MVTPEYYKKHNIGKDTDMRFRWDNLVMAAIEGNSARWICDVLYPLGLNDDHIDTALRKAVADVWGVGRGTASIDCPASVTV